MGARLVDDPHRSVAEHPTQLRATDGLEALRIDGDDGVCVWATFDDSYLALEPAAQRLFRLLGLPPGMDLTAEAAAALAATTSAEARRLLDRLVSTCLLEVRPAGRYGFHDLLCRYAQTRIHDDSERVPAVQRLFDWYLYGADAASNLLYSNMARLPSPPPTDIPRPAFEHPAAARMYLDAERSNPVAAVRHAAEHGPQSSAWLLTDALRGYFWYGRHAGDPPVRRPPPPTIRVAKPSPSSRSLPDARCSPNYQALDHYRRALAVCREVGWLRGEPAMLTNLGLLYCLSGRLGQAEQTFHQVLERATDVPTAVHRCTAMLNLALVVYAETGRLRRAAEQYAAVLPLVRQLPSPSTEALALTGLGDVCRALGELEAAAHHLDRRAGAAPRGRQPVRRGHGAGQSG